MHENRVGMRGAKKLRMLPCVLLCVPLVGVLAAKVDLRERESIPRVASASARARIE